MEAVSRIVKRVGRRTFLLSTAVAGLVGIFVCLEIFSILRDSSKEKRAQYLVARRDLPQGHPLNFLDLGLRSATTIPKIPEGAFTDQDLHLIKGARLKMGLVKGEILTLDKTILSPVVIGLGRSVPKGLRAYLIVTSKGVYARAGDRIDILLTPQQARDIPVTLVEGAQVLQAQSRDELSEIVVAVTRGEIRILEKAQQSGKLTIALRNPGERVGQRFGRKPAWRRKKKQKQKIEIFSEE